MDPATRASTRLTARLLCAGASLCAAAAAAQAPGGGVGDPLPPAAPAAAAQPATGKAELAPVTITGNRPDDTAERRNSTASKIVIGRDEIDRFGDSTLGDVLKRLPGVTLQGRPGRGGAIRMRGLGNGYTQILLDGERVPPGFSLDSITPDQIERIEILRAPTAETGARAIAGTINIVTRGGYTKRVNDVKLSAGLENGDLQPGVSWSRNFTTGPLIVNYSLSAYRFAQDSSSTTTTEDRVLDANGNEGNVTLAQRDEGRVRVTGHGLHATARLQWRPENGVDSVTLTPVFFYSRVKSRGEGVLTQSVGDTPAPYDHSLGESRSSTSLTRLTGEWTHRLGGAAVAGNGAGGGDRVETRASVGQSRRPGQTLRTERTGGNVTRTLDDSSDSHDTSVTASGKLVRTLFEEHSFVAGAELESNRRADVRTTLQQPDPLPPSSGDNFSANALRIAAYAQDEWNLTPQWGVHAGLRWEGIRTRGSVAEGQPDAINRSGVWSPLLHAVWKPDPKSRDQVRMSLTRSYRSPTLGDLIARPVFNSRYPIGGPNTPTQADRAGNPDLKPELATGIDLAVERYLPGSGLLSANVFRRDITNYMRSVTRLETVAYSSVPRYVLRPQNVGSAVTQGLELEAKFRASELWAAAPKVDVRANVSVFSSRVKEVPGPDNRLDQQPGATANLGGDYRFSGMPLTLGGNVNWTPGYTTRLSDVQTAFMSRKIVADAYALWVFNPALQLRFSLSNLAPSDYLFGASVDGPDIQGRNVRERSTTTQPTFVNAQLRLEMKL